MTNNNSNKMMTMTPPTFKDWCNIHCVRIPTRPSTHELLDEHGLQLSVRDDMRSVFYQQMATDITNGHMWHLSVSEFVCDEFRFFVPLSQQQQQQQQQPNNNVYESMMRQAIVVQQCVGKFFSGSDKSCIVLANEYGYGRLVFPFLIVTRAQAREMMFFIEGRLRSSSSSSSSSSLASTSYVEGAHVLMPLNVYYGQCLRATGHGKNRTCPCLPEAQHRRGLIFHGAKSAYWPRYVVDGQHHEDKHSFQSMQDKPFDILQYCTIHRIQMPLTSGYSRPAGAEPLMQLSLSSSSSSSSSKTTKKRKRPLIEDHYFKSTTKEKEKDDPLLEADKQTYSDFKIRTVVPETDRRAKAFREWFVLSSVACLGSRYENVDVRFMKTNKKNDAYIVQLRGENVNYCPHAKTHHGDSTMFLHILSKPSFCIHLRCHSKTYAGCNVWSQYLMVLPRDLSVVLFASVNTTYSNLVRGPCASARRTLSTSSSTNPTTQTTKTSISFMKDKEKERGNEKAILEKMDAVVQEQHQQCATRALEHSVPNGASLSPVSALQQLLRKKSLL